MKIKRTLIISQVDNGYILNIAESIGGVTEVYTDFGMVVETIARELGVTKTGKSYIEKLLSERTISNFNKRTPISDLEPLFAEGLDNGQPTVGSATGVPHFQVYYHSDGIKISGDFRSGKLFNDLKSDMENHLSTCIDHRRYIDLQEVTFVDSGTIKWVEDIIYKQGTTRTCRTDSYASRAFEEYHRAKSLGGEVP